MKKHNLALCLVFLLFLCSCSADAGKDPTVGLYQTKTTYLTEECAERTIRITCQREDLLSIVFEGLYNDRTAAHPIHLFFALNIEPKSGETVAFSDRYAIDDALYETFAACAERDITENAGGTWPEGWGTFSDTICDKDSFLNGMRTSLDFSVFFAEEGVGISYPVPYALGDHMEVILPYDALT